VFNGDADGLCALHQLRLKQPVDSILITGVKRDINLLRKVDAGTGDRVTVLDISMDKNKEGLEQLLGNNVSVIYFDHHYPGESLPKHLNLDAYIDTSPEVCTSLLVNDFINGQFLPWAVTAAFGDNLPCAARNAAKQLDYSESQLETLCELGICLNYNGYGPTVEDLYFHPASLYEKIKPYSSPFDFVNNEEAYQVLRTGYYEDIANAEKIAPEFSNDSVSLYILPDEKWARRVSGVYGNQLSTSVPDNAHAILTILPEGGYQVSVRAPQTNKTGADELCRSFSSGGGRKGAAGINLLPEEDLELFIQRFQQQYQKN